jgi:hypothetical protein
MKDEDCDAHALFGEGVAEKHRVAFGSAPLESKRNRGKIAALHQRINCSRLVTTDQRDVGASMGRDAIGNCFRGLLRTCRCCSVPVVDHQRRRWLGRSVDRFRRKVPNQSFRL